MVRFNLLQSRPWSQMIPCSKSTQRTPTSRKRTLFYQLPRLSSSPPSFIPIDHRRRSMRALSDNDRIPVGVGVGVGVDYIIDIAVRVVVVDPFSLIAWCPSCCVLLFNRWRWHRADAVLKPAPQFCFLFNLFPSDAYASDTYLPNQSHADFEIVQLPVIHTYI